MLFTWEKLRVQRSSCTYEIKLWGQRACAPNLSLGKVRGQSSGWLLAIAGRVEIGSQGECPRSRIKGQRPSSHDRQ